MTADVDLVEAFGWPTTRALGDLVVLSNLAQRPFSAATHEAADNLLAKARRALAAGQTDRADRYIDRALRLPYDDHEDADPALWSAEMVVFATLADALVLAHESDNGWLTAAARVLETSPPAARGPLLRTLHSIARDYLTHRPRRRVTTVPSRYAAPGANPSDGPHGLDDATRAQLIRDTLTLALQLKALLTT